MKLTQRTAEQLIKLIPESTTIVQNDNGRVLWASSNDLIYNEHSGSWIANVSVASTGNLGVYELNSKHKTMMFKSKECDNILYYPQGILIRVRNGLNEPWRPRYSAGTINDKGELNCWVHGKTIYTANGKTQSWKYIDTYNSEE